MTIADIADIIILGTTGIILILQARAMVKASQASTFVAAMGLLQSEDVRKARGWVLGELRTKVYPYWDEHDKAMAAQVCQAYDSVGIIARENMIPARLIADSWGESLTRSWDILKPFVQAECKQRGFEFLWDDFQWLAAQAETLETQRSSSRSPKRRLTPPAG